MQQFLFLFRGGDPTAVGLSGEAAMQQWARWVAELKSSGAFVHGEPLQGPGRLLGPGARRIDEAGGAPTEASTPPVSGYLAIRCDDMAAAEKVAAGCPVLSHGGLVEVRPSWVVNGAAP